ncbi:MAG: hypothetical protein AB8B69_21280, partial [Chitinophagales bacterium]
MNLEDIDNIFNNNQHQFDKMPSDQLWERLEDKLDATPSIWEEKPQTKVKWLRYVAAAAVILMMTIPAIYLIEGPTTNSKEVAANYSADEPSTTSSIEEKSAGRINKLEDTGSMVETFDKDLAAKTDNPIEATTEDKSELIAKADTEKKPTFTAKKETTSKQFALQNNKNQNIEKPKKITSPKPKPTVSDRSLKMAKKPAIPSMSDDTEAGDFDAEYAIEEEMEIALDEVNVTAYKNTPPPAPKAASVRA